MVVPLFNNTVTCHIKDLCADMKSVLKSQDFSALQMGEPVNMAGLVILLVFVHHQCELIRVTPK